MLRDFFGKDTNGKFFPKGFSSDSIGNYQVNGNAPVPVEAWVNSFNADALQEDFNEYGEPDGEQGFMTIVFFQQYYSMVNLLRENKQSEPFINYFIARFCASEGDEKKKHAESFQNDFKKVLYALQELIEDGQDLRFEVKVKLFVGPERRGRERHEFFVNSIKSFNRCWSTRCTRLISQFGSLVGNVIYPGTAKA